MARGDGIHRTSARNAKLADADISKTQGHNEREKESYMMMWIVIAFASFFIAYICWYAKGEGIIAIFISSMIMGVLLAQAFNLNFTQGFYMYHFLEVITWLIGVILLRKKPKEYVIEIGLSVVIAFIYQLVMPHWG